MKKTSIIHFTLLVSLSLCQIALKYNVSAESCIGCFQCVVVCPTDAIEIIDGKAVIDADKCISCGKCAEVCPTGAIVKLPQKNENVEQNTFIDTFIDTSYMSVPMRKEEDTTIIARAPAQMETTETKNLRKAFVISEKCVGCGICVNVCPTDAIELIDGKAVVDPEKCTSCGVCLTACPTKAIEMR